MSETPLKLFKDKSDFSLYIEEQVLKTKLTHMEAILEYCEKCYIDPEEIVKLFTKSLLEKVKVNFIDLNYFPKAHSLFENTSG